MILRSLSSRLVVGVLLVVAVVLAGGGLIIVKVTEHRDQRDADADLTRFAKGLAPTIVGTLGVPAVGPVNRPPGPPLLFLAPGARPRVVVPQPPAAGLRRGVAPNPGPARALVDAFNQRGENNGPAGQIQFVRAIAPASGDELILGDVPPGFPAVATAPGTRTATVDGQAWRLVTLRLPQGLTIDVGAQASAISARAGQLRNVVIWTALGGMAVALVLTLVVSRVTLRPLNRLARRAGDITGTEDLTTRVSEPGDPREVAGLAQELDGMLGRLEDASADREAALLAARRFAADAGHELRTPLQSVRANLDIAGSAEAGEEERREALRQASSQSERLKRLVDGLQTLARGEAGLGGTMDEVDLGDIADGALYATRTRHPELTLQSELPESGPVVHGDADGLWRAIENLLENAARHGRPGGRVRLRVRSENGRAEVLIEDDGPGIPGPERLRVTQRFVRGQDAAAAGSGLGLAIVDAEARRHGGELTLGDSELGGLLARVTIPR